MRVAACPVLLLVAGLALSGCIDLKKFQRESNQTRADLEQVREHDDRENCIADGALPGSDTYLGCMLKRANGRAQLAPKQPAAKPSDSGSPAPSNPAP